MVMSTGLVYDDRFLEHDTGPSHPERSQRLEAIVRRLRDGELWDRLVHLPFESADMGWVHRIHDPAYVDRLRDACARRLPFIDVVDSGICCHSFDVAQLAVGGALGAVDAVMSNRVRNAFCAVRPPGHHAERDRSMGFCLFNNIAISAQYLREQYKLDRVAVVDFDVHHGNGTQHIFEDRADVLFISLHQHPASLYPGTGFQWESGRGPGEGKTINIPMNPGSSDDAYREAFTSNVLPNLEHFWPQALLISAGFDGAAHDPLSHLMLTAEGYGWMSAQLKDIAERLCQGRIVSMLEGGYDLRSLAECVAAHVAVLLGDG